MIRYESGDIFFNIFKCAGSVFPRAFAVACPCSLVSVMICLLIQHGYAEALVDPEESVLRDNAAWSGFSFLVGFLIVFRTSQSYNRFWDGCTSTHMMRAEWFDGCSSLLAFCRHSDAADADICIFQNTLVRLFSMLHSAALADIEDTSSEDVEDVASFQFELIDVEGIDDNSLLAVRDSEAKVELIFQWIQSLIVDNISTGVLSIPAPILSRSFQEIANGMVAFHDAMKISQIPFPFPYAQTCDFLLVLHWLIVPFVVTQWVKEAYWAFVFSFIQVFILWVLNMIAVELENPFGHDANDIDGQEMQLEMNTHLLLLMSPSAFRAPHLKEGVFDLRDQGDSATHRIALRHAVGKSFVDIWRQIENSAPEVGAEDSARPSQNITVHRNSVRTSGSDFAQAGSLPFSARGSLRSSLDQIKEEFRQGDPADAEPGSPFSSEAQGYTPSNSKDSPFSSEARHATPRKLAPIASPAFRGIQPPGPPPEASRAPPQLTPGGNQIGDAAFYEWGEWCELPTSEPQNGRPLPSIAVDALPFEERTETFDAMDGQAHALSNTFAQDAGPRKGSPGPAVATACNPATDRPPDS